MKRIISLIFITVLFATSICNAATPQEEAKFLASVRAAIANKNKEAYVALHCLDRATDKQKASVARDADFFLNKKYTVLEIRDRDPSQPKEFTIGGVKHSPNLEISKILYMKYTNEMNAKSKIQKNLGEKDGKLMFALLVPTN
jgi:hypothetical protein